MLLQINSNSAKRTFAGMVLAAVVAVAVTASPASPSSPLSGGSGDSISPGFFNPPPGVQPVNLIQPSSFTHARRSYAWRMHDGKRQLIAFSTPIQHVVVIYMENRTPEDLFGAYYNSPAPNGTPLGSPSELDLVNPASVTSPTLSPEPLNAANDPNHEHEPGFVAKAQNTGWSTWKGASYVETPSPELSVPSVINYIDFIEQFGYANHVFQSNEGPSFESHQYAIAAQSGGLLDSSITPYGMVNNPGVK
jgi:phospholipase C